MTGPAGKRRVVYDDGRNGYYLSAADMLELNPPALFSERRRIEEMGQVRLGLYLILHALILPKSYEAIRAPTRMERLRWRVWRWVR